MFALASTAQRYRLHVLYEHGIDLRPYVSSHVRLLRPLSHPSIIDAIELSWGTELCDGSIDLVAIDRLWRPDVTVERAERLVRDVRQRGARILYSVDDNLFAKDGELSEGEEARRAVIETFLRAADQVLVTTENLRHALEPYATRVTRIPNYLDERLLATRPRTDDLIERLSDWRRDPARDIRTVTIGYMGTRTHDRDLQLVNPALRRVLLRHDGRVRLEMIGGVSGDKGSQVPGELPWVRKEPGQLYAEYPSFLPWFLAVSGWDIGLAPLADTVLNASKSDLKFLDYAAIGAAGLFSSTPTYRPTVTHGVTGFLVNNDTEAWEEALEHAIVDAAHAKTVGYLAQSYLHEFRTLAQGAVHWLDLIRQCVRK